jgi:hypothetical protein
VTILVLLACAGSGSTAHAAETTSGLQVTVMIYSGRPNPTFAIEDAAALSGVHNALSAAEVREGFDRETVVPSVLGYNGIRIDNRTGFEDLPKVLLIYGGTVELQDGGKRFLADPDRRLERSLIEQAVERQVLDGAALELIRKELGKGPGPVYQ